MSSNTSLPENVSSTASLGDLVRQILCPGLVAGPASPPYVTAFFESLLPEGDQSRMISLREHVTSVLVLLSCVGGESAGAFTLLPEGETPQPPVYQPLTRTV